MTHESGTAYMETIQYYDNHGQAIQTKSKNHLGSMEKEYFAYTFTGQVKIFSVKSP